MSSSTAHVAARVAIADTEANVLFLVVQYLRSLGLSTTVVALLRESGLDPFWLCGPSREVALLREWVFQGEWARVRALLTPLQDALGEDAHGEAIALVEKQVLTEEFFTCASDGDASQRRRHEILAMLQSNGSTHNAMRLTPREMERCVDALQADKGRDRGAGRERQLWSLDEARLDCFASLVPLFREEIGEDDEEAKYLSMSPRQLVALLHDALHFHQQRRQQQQPNAEDGDSEDIVSVTPFFSSAAMGEKQTEGDLMASSSLRLVATSERPQRPFYPQGDTRTVDVTQSFSYDRLSTSALHVSQEIPPSEDSALSKRGTRNPLAMSMGFLPRQQRRRERPAAHQVIEEPSSDTAQDKEKTGVNKPVDASTQTMEIVVVEHEEPPSPLRRDPLVAVLSVPTQEGDDCCQLPSKQAASPVSVHAKSQPVSPTWTNQTEAVLHTTTTTAHASSSGGATKSISSSLRLVDPPLEAWCTSRGKTKSDDNKQLDASTMEPETHDEPNDDSDSEGEDQDMDHATATAVDVDDMVDDVQEDAYEHLLVPVRLYSQLTIDSVVRAHVIAEVREAQAIRAMDISPDGTEMVIGTNARALRVFDLVEPLANASVSGLGGGAASSFLPLLPVSMERHKHHASPIYVAAYNHAETATSSSPLPLLIATGAAESSIKVLSRWTQQEVWIRGHAGKCRALQFVSPQLLCSAASSDLVIRCWDLESASHHQCVQRFDGHVGEIQALAVSSLSQSSPIDKRCFVSSSMDRTVRLWDLRSAQCARVLARTLSPAFAVAFQPQDSSMTTNATPVLATGHQDGSVSLWDLRFTKDGARPLATISHHHDECRAVSWSPDGRWLLSGSFDGTLCLLEAAASSSTTANTSSSNISATTSDPLVAAVASFHQHHDKVLQAQWHPTQPAIITTGADKLVKLWSFTS